MIESEGLVLPMVCSHLLKVWLIQHLTVEQRIAKQKHVASHSIKFEISYEGMQNILRVLVYMQITKNLRIMSF